MHERSKSLVKIHAATLITSTVALFGKFLPLPPVLIVSGRVTFASLALLVYVFVQKESLRLRTLHDGIGLALIGGVFAFHWISFFHSVQVSTVAISSLAFASSPVIIAMIEPLFFREKYHWKHFAVAFATVAGIGVMTSSTGSGGNIVQGMIWGLLSAVSFALLSVCNRGFVRKYPGTVIALYQDLSAALILLPVAFVLSPMLDTRSLVLLLILGVVHTAVAHTLFIQAMTHVSARTMSIIVSLEPVYAVALAIPLVGEIPDTRIVLGGCILLAAAISASLMKEGPAKVAML